MELAASCAGLGITGPLGFEDFLSPWVAQRVLALPNFGDHVHKPEANSKHDTHALGFRV